MRNLPFSDFEDNEVWLELSLAAQDLVAWAKVLVLDGRARARRAQAAAPPSAARRRADTAHLALGGGAPGRLREAAGAAGDGAALSLGTVPGWISRNSSLRFRPCTGTERAVPPFGVDDYGDGQPLTTHS